MSAAAGCAAPVTLYPVLMALRLISVSPRVRGAESVRVEVAFMDIATGLGLIAGAIVERRLDDIYIREQAPSTR